MFGQQLKHARQAKKLSLRRLAKAIHVSHVYLWEIEEGRKPGTVEIAELCDRELGTGTALAALASMGTHDAADAIAAIGRADVDRRAFLRSAAYSAAMSALPLDPAFEAAPRLAGLGTGRTVGAADVDAIVAVTEAFTRHDEVRGGAVGRTAVAEFLSTDVSALLKQSFASEDVRAQALSSAGETAYLLGWKSHDEGLSGLAQRYYLSALRLAEESGVPGHDAFVLRILALQGPEVGQNAYSPALAEEALRRAAGTGDDATLALYQVAVARCHAEVGNADEARAAVQAAEAHLHPDGVGEIPHWLRIWCPNKATLLNQAALTFAALGEWNEAERFYHLVTTLWSPTTHARVYALAEASTGFVQWRLGREGDAEQSWRRAIPILEGLGSQRARAALERISAIAPELVRAPT